MGHVRKLDLRFLQNKTETFLVSVTHLILRFTILQNKFQQTNKTKINHINDNHIKVEVSLHFLGIWPTVRRRYCTRLLLLAVLCVDKRGEHRIGRRPRNAEYSARMRI